MAGVSPLPQPSFWVKREYRPPVKPRKDPLSRDYLTGEEVEAMIAAARKAGGRTADRDALLIMLAYRHGLRASELTALGTWEPTSRRTVWQAGSPCPTGAFCCATPAQCPTGNRTGADKSSSSIGRDQHRPQLEAARLLSVKFRHTPRSSVIRVS